ncbi:protein kinase [Ancylothrix sp. C2]|uniref:serine/threonine protein kinase n=1 Tax=Ancylothrix sp. D3o TaxID=2953691 RepID=UPI0021BB5384|nr:protein kinase [Ancylothrix sp. D3o]MCT7949044.1 protein kinase [Ancylothrix sp. D3o]
MKNFPDFSRYGYHVNRVLETHQKQRRITYLATDLKQKRQIVIKQFKGFQSNRETWDAIKTEIQLHRRLNHPGIAGYQEAFKNPAGLYLVREYKKASPAASPQQYSAEQIKKIAISLLETLVYLQTQTPTLTHGNIKPQNILVGENNDAYLIDLGLNEEAASPESDVFQPPEKLSGNLTKSSDLYSLGMTLICLVAGVKFLDVEKCTRADGRLDLKTLLPSLSERFRNWLEKMIQPNPKDRYFDAATALDALKKIDVSPSFFENIHRQLLSQINFNR